MAAAAWSPWTNPAPSEPTPEIDVAAYLARIAYQGATTPSFTTLAGLQLAHLRAVPFENLDVLSRRPISLQPADLYTKIVARRRGGFCYELNGLFATLLRRLGFQVTLLAATCPGGRDRSPQNWITWRW
jgi:N-hydroxyarylamine O-acetyltransferase